MTNREKFISVFGIDFEVFDESDIDKPYRKFKKYLYELRRWKKVNGETRFGNDRTIQGCVYATNVKDARKKAIKQLGDSYKTFNSGRPIYCLKIKEII